MHRVLGRDDPEIVAFARRQLAADGVEIHEGIAIRRVARDGNAIAVRLEKDGMTTTLTGSHRRVAEGRKASVEGPRLDADGVAHTPKGLNVEPSPASPSIRTSSTGDVRGGRGCGRRQV